MKNKSCVSTNAVLRVLILAAAVSLAGCAGTNQDEALGTVPTPTVDYIETLDVYSAPHKDSFLNQLAMNYRSYAIYNARTSGYPEMGELFAQKAVAAFSGELPFPESLENWPIDDEQAAFEVHTAYTELIEELKNDASMKNPELAAEAQAKFDCWISALASGQIATAKECRSRYVKTMNALRDSTGRIIPQQTTSTSTIASGEMVVEVQKTKTSSADKFYPDTRNMRAMAGAGRAREGVIVVNNVNVPEHLIRPVPVQPVVFNQNIYGGDKTIKANNNNKVDCVNNNSDECVPVMVRTMQEMPKPEPKPVAEPQPVAAPVPPAPTPDVVTREEFVDMMLAMRAELAAINARLDKIEAAANDKTIIKVQQIPLEPKQHVMEEIFEIRFDFDKATIKPEYVDLIKQLATATQNNKNIKVSVFGHTDTMGTEDYNYALGGKRAEAVQRMLINYGIPASQIVAVSMGEEDLKVPTPDGVANAENRRVRVVKEIHYQEPSAQTATELQVREGAAVCGEYGCAM